MQVFEYALTYTAGEDLSKILWLKSDNSEAWLQRRATYTRSLAVMSMVGYVLGLGDRHPSNLMLDRQSGKVLHIDFGDCFEVAMRREKFPEKVPFRLTRMLVNAMEVAGIEGNYRSTCEKVMDILRENRDSLVATLEAFVHDPLISWRLLNTKKYVFSLSVSVICGVIVVTYFLRDVCIFFFFF
jgi:serine/threonine-protein kinase mTOR